MLTVNLDSITTTLIVTVTEMTTVENPSYRLVLHSPYTNKTYRFDLPLNTSLFQDRYDEFVMPTEVFKELDKGMYTYSIFQDDSEVKPAETGYLTIISNAVDEYASISREETEDDYITYKPK